jgi:hypothetical protein
MKFLALVKSSEKYRAEGPPPALLEAMGRLGDTQGELQSRGAGEQQEVHR